MYTVDRTTPDYIAAISVGFSFDTIKVETPNTSDTILYAFFTCVCGNREYIAITLADLLFYGDLNKRRFLKGTHIDIAGLLYTLGSFSDEHLRNDGYSELQRHRILSDYEYIKEQTQLICHYKMQEAA